MTFDLLEYLLYWNTGAIAKERLMSSDTIITISILKSPLLL